MSRSLRPRVPLVRRRAVDLRRTASAVCP
ncbi:putative leader peptide [Rhodococcus antarcticus]